MNRFARWQLAHRSLQKNRFTFSRGAVMRVALLLLICGAIIAIAVTHDFFAITDVAISGLDSYGAVRVRSLVNKQRQNYFTFSVRALERAINRELVLESFTAKKKFPHTILVHAREIPAVATITTRNASGAIAADGRVVRVFKNIDGFLTGNEPRIDLLFDVTLHPHDVPLSSENFAAVHSLLFNANFVEQRALKQIMITDTNVHLIRVRYNGGAEAIVTTQGDMDTQIEKLRAAFRTYPAARFIDVRFGDKAFVEF